ncbi:MAG TPA: PEP/pyruvate-binding domain-containing protein, partial [Polyangiaceae bacterium]|nr:PEP/pyruvate-binding domain-containing protein [Polyangiaceae bacterium]
RLVFCSPATPAAPNTGCEVLSNREVGDYVRHLRTLEDFNALAAGAGELGMASVKFILDMAAGNQVYLVGTRDWSLHYEFVRELIYQQPHLDRCDSAERDQFDLGWYRFSVSEYFQTTGRRFLLGTLVHHAAADLYTVEFTLGDAILAEDMRRAFFAATSHALDPTAFHLRPQDDEQRARVQQLDGTVPIVDQNAPFSTTKLQTLTAGVGYGVLTYVPTVDLQSASLGPDVIVVTDDVPTDIPLVGGLVTEAFQTPLSHVNVLCQNRGTPNLALPQARLDPEIAALFGKLVRFEVTSDGYQVRPASAEEAQSFWDARKPSQVALSPRLDLEQTDLVDLRQASLADLPAIGAKAAQLAELIQLSKSYVPNCDGAAAFEAPEPAFAVPMSYFAQHARTSGASALLDDLLANPEIYANRTTRHARLAAIRDAIRLTPVEPNTLKSLKAFFKQHFGTTRMRMRSSSNAEDLPGFNGAGLYSSMSAAIDDPDYPIDDALREIWASLYSDRGFDERIQFNIEQQRVAMAVLVHPAYPEERANAVVISRNMDDVTRGDIYTFNAQRGEASVTNPAPGVSSDQFTYQWPPREPALAFKTLSSFGGSTPVLSEREVVSAACALRAIVEHFRLLLDPERSNSYFTMDMEMKLLGDERQLLIKQARPYAFGGWINPGDCREL